MKNTNIKMFGFLFKTNNRRIMVGALLAAVVLLFATPLFPFDEFAALAVALIAGVLSLIE